jgi:aldose 1-epimerase
VVASVDLLHGGRLASLIVRGIELLAPRQRDNDLLHWGCYPLAPWAGRVRNAMFPFDGRMVGLETDLPPHAIHGLGYRFPWTAAGPAHLQCDLSSLWDFGGRLDQRLVITFESLELSLTVTATTKRMPAMLGWHPCFRRRLATGAPEVVLGFEPTGMWERDASDIPTGRIIDVPKGPWDDCFSGVAQAPVLTWPGQRSLRIESETPNWVIFDELPEIVCVEPLTDAPDVFNRRPTVLEPGESTTLTMRLVWEPPPGHRSEQEQQNA